MKTGLVVACCIVAAVLVFSGYYIFIDGQSKLVEVEITVIDDTPTIEDYTEIPGVPDTVKIYLYHRNDYLPGISYFELITTLINPVHTGSNNKYSFSGSVPMSKGDVLCAGYDENEFGANFIDGNSLVRIDSVYWDSLFEDGCGQAVVHHWICNIAIF